MPCEHNAYRKSQKPDREPLETGMKSEIARMSSQSFRAVHRITRSDAMVIFNVGKRIRGED